MTRSLPDKAEAKDSLNQHSVFQGTGCQSRPTDHPPSWRAWHENSRKVETESALAVNAMASVCVRSSRVRPSRTKDNVGT